MRIRLQAMANVSGHGIRWGWEAARLVCILNSSTAALRAAAPVDYVREVKPVFTQYCVRCHGADRDEASLRVDTAVELRRGGDSGSPLRIDRPDESLLLQVLQGAHPDLPPMPYKRPPLPPEDIAKIRRWIAEGAAAPATEEPGRFVHWAFVPPIRADPPAVRAKDWPRNAIDRFILARLEANHIEPSPAADRVTLLRRVSLDLIGLTPTPDEIMAFELDRRADAYERAVERLLASPHFGERWARPWLDAARYADSNGYADLPRQIWRYRDWVIDALNRDLPYDRFVIEQLAGDLLPNATSAQKVATGFNRNTAINQEGGIDPEQFRIESVFERVETFGTVFLGLTIGCAQCHDHKFDPISQREYYRLFAFFNQTVPDGHGQIEPSGIVEFVRDGDSRERSPRELEEAREKLDRFLIARRNEIVAWSAELTADARAALRPNVQAALETRWERQSLEQRRVVYAAFRGEDPEFVPLSEAFARLSHRSRLNSTLIMVELPQTRETHLLIGGDFTRRGEKVTAGTPAILPPLPPASAPTRLDLARWTVDAANPLAARVVANRMWQQYFGRGLVATENDFGTQGAPPTHPELLDWLATELVRQEWSMKAIHRLIVTSATYRQSSHARPDLREKDPSNELLARQPRLRLDAEIVRDVALAASGLLVPKLGGRPVFPPQPDGLMNANQSTRQWKVSLGEDRYRRGLYTHRWRTSPHPALGLFDAPDGSAACTRRLRSNTPLQALVLLNDRQFYEFAQALAARVQRDATGALESQLEHAFRLCVARSPTAAERQRITTFYWQQIAGATGEDADRRHAAWIAVARVLLNLDETITRE